MANMYYRYLHIDSADRNPHNHSARMDIHLMGNAITNCKRVAVIKASITNTGHNIYDGKDSVHFGIYVTSVAAGVEHSHIIQLSVPQGYHSIAETVLALNNSKNAYTNESAKVQNSVRALNFTIVSGKIKITAGAISGSSCFYVPLVPSGDKPNTIWEDLGVTTMTQTATFDTWLNEISYDIENGFIINGTGGQFIKQNAASNLIGIQNNVDNVISIQASHLPKIENPKGFYFSSSTLTSKNNALETIKLQDMLQLNHSEHLVYIPNRSDREEYNHYETNFVEWHNIEGTIQNFDIELRSSDNILYQVNPDKLADGHSLSAIPPFTCTLCFECQELNETVASNSMTYAAEGYFKAHRQN